MTSLVVACMGFVLAAGANVFLQWERIGRLHRRLDAAEREIGRMRGTGNWFN